MTAAIDAIAVVIPAHDEAALLDACLTSVESAAAQARGLVDRADVWVVLDACRDDSAAIAAAHGVGVLSIDARSVGAARAAGVAHALTALADVPVARIWTAHTDADSIVPPHWLVHQLELARAGADAVVGTVRPDFRDLSCAQIAAWRATHTPGIANGHVHGANLGVRAGVLLDAGGFSPDPVHEDVRLIDAVRANGGRIVASDGAWVLTSGRQVGRAPGGYARYLREDLLPAARAMSLTPDRLA